MEFGINFDKEFSPDASCFKILIFNMRHRERKKIFERKIFVLNKKLLLKPGVNDPQIFLYGTGALLWCRGVDVNLDEFFVPVCITYLLCFFLIIVKMYLMYIV